MFEQWFIYLFKARCFPSNMKSASTAVWLPHGGHAHWVSDRVAVPRERAAREELMVSTGYAHTHTQRKPELHWPTELARDIGVSPRASISRWNGEKTVGYYIYCITKYVYCSKVNGLRSDSISLAFLQLGRTVNYISLLSETKIHEI